MICDMPRPRPSHLNKHITQCGTVLWYVRKGHGPRIRLTAPFGSAEFQDQYDTAIAGIKPARSPHMPGEGSLAWLIGLYRKSPAWASLRPATRRQREGIFLAITKTAGNVPVSQISKADIVKGRDRRSPASGAHFVIAMRSLFKWAVDSAVMTENPADGVKSGRPKSDGFEPWLENDIAAFEARWPVGTRERVAFGVLLGTGLRRSDAIRLGAQHVKDGIIRLTTRKTGERVAILIESALATTLATGPCGDLTFITSTRGTPFNDGAFGKFFRAACDAAGVAGKSAHGLRKAGAIRDAERGFTEAELDAKYGWRGGQMASKYTRAMNRERLSLQAARRTRQNDS
jgi:integrase